MRFQMNSISSPERAEMQTYWWRYIPLVLANILISSVICTRMRHSTRLLLLKMPQIVRGSIITLLLLATLSLSLPCIIIMFLLFPPAKLIVYTSVADYTITVEQVFAGYDIGSNTYLVITHRNEKYTSDLESDTDCTSLATFRHDNRIYFVCNDAAISPRTPYVDVVGESVYMGGDTPQHEVLLTDISY